MATLAVRATGMMTAVGLSSPATYAALRAGISGVTQSQLWDPTSGECITAARVPLRQWWEGAEKSVDLLTPAVEECLAAAAPVPASRIPVLVGTPSPDRLCRWSGLDEQILPSLQAKLGVRFHEASAVLPRGNVAGVVGIQRARELIDGGEVSRCIVAGVDSLVHQETVIAYLDQWRVLTPANSNGFIPGEAGTAMLLGPAGSAGSPEQRQSPPTPELHILGLGLAREKAIIASEEPLRGDGLAEAIQSALAEAGLKIDDLAYRITDLNGEHYKFKEASLAFTRLGMKPRPEPFDIWHPIEFVGEIGAAIVPCVMGWALHAGIKGYAPGLHVLSHFSNDDEERAAVVARFVQGGATP
jgi:3-oxoacyl-[acyl-carrier-protein] synthase-1